VPPSRADGFFPFTSTPSAFSTNGLGLRTATPGMYGPRMASVHEVSDHFGFATPWDGENDVLGAEPTGGLFAVGFGDHPYRQRTWRTELDGMGGYAAYGRIESLQEPGWIPGAPICIAGNMTRRRDVARDERIGWDDVDYDAADPAIARALEAMAEDRDP
jgi:predicted homoserine dehydrogenase-like protein